MVKAFEMMLQTECSLSEFAYSIGYQSFSAFSNTFYQFTNFRPSNFKYHKNQGCANSHLRQSPATLSQLKIS